ncbi:sigma-70 family RNA polymerase sigma factor [Patescibacteria group bacterium]
MGREYDHLLERYEQKVAKYPLLTREEVCKLVIEARAGNKSAFDWLVMCNQRLIIKRAFYWWRRKLPRHLSKMDLVIEGNCEFLRKILDFDETRGTQLSTFIVRWLDSAMATAIKNKDLDIRISKGAHEWRDKAEDLLARLYSLGIEIDKDLFCLVRKYKDKKGNLTKVVKSIRQVQTETATIKAPFFPLDSPQFISGDPSGDASYLRDFVKDETALSPDSRVEFIGIKVDSFDYKKLIAQLKVLAGLRPIEERVIDMRFGLEDGKEYLLREVGEVLGGLSRERIRQIERDALNKLRNAYKENFVPQDVAA